MLGVTVIVYKDNSKIYQKNGYKSTEMQDILLKGTSTMKLLEIKW